MTTIEKLESEIESIRNQIGELDHNVRSIFVNGVGMRALHEEKQAEFKALLIEHSAPQVLHLGNSLSHTNGILQIAEGSRFVASKILVDLVEAMPEFIAAHATIAPLLAEIARLEAEVAAEVQLRGEKQTQLNLAREQALAKAQAAALQDPLVKAAEDALAALERPATARKSKQSVAESGVEVS